MGECPRPDKVAYTTEADAQPHLMALRQRTRAFDLETYQCACGAWHVGTNPRTFGKRINRALNHESPDDRRKRERHRRAKR